MRIGIDARDILRRQTGIVTYTTNLVREISLRDDESEYILYLDTFKDPEVGDQNVVTKENIRPQIISGPGVLWKQLSLPVHLMSDGVDLFHSPTSTIPIVRPAKTVVTFCDLFHEANPQWTPEKIKKRLSKLYRFAARNSDSIIAISESTKKDLVKFYGVDPEKITVIYPGKDEFFKPVEEEKDLQAIKIRFGVEDGFMLHVGALSEWRNVPRLVEAFSSLGSKHGIKHKLVLVGRQFWGFDLAQVLNKYRLQDAVINLPYVSKEDLRLLYNAADVLIFPSLYEGFGIPAIEAMACGTPVVSSTKAALPEAVGDAAVLIDPYSTDSIANGVMRILEDQELKDDLVKRGFAQAKRFSWKKMAAETVEAYSQIA